ncbi:MAG: PD-(D/E)XK nuclease family protein, partial [Candidatus Zixiibacteriota bacterium]
VEDYINRGAEMLKKYYEIYAPFDDSEVLALEKNISFPLDDNERFIIKSRIDRISRRKADGVIEIVDYKTDRSLPAQAVLDHDEQLGLYHIGINKLWPQFEKIEAKKIFLRQGIEMSTSMDEDRLEEIRYQAFQKVIEIENAIREDNFPPKESVLCDWCIFYELCPAKRHKLALDDKITDDFDAKSGKEMAEKYLDLNRKKKLIESELTALKDDLVTFCERADLTNIVAEHGSLTVKISEGEQFPSKTSSEKDYLEMSILARDAGLDECFKLDQNVLYKEFYRTGRLPDDLTEKLRDYLIVRKNSIIRTFHKKE